MRALIIVLLSVSVLAAQDVPDDFVITLERQHCGGECPVYSVRIDASGLVAYEGKDFVRATGARTGRVSSEDVASLAAMAEKIGFFQLRDKYATIRDSNGIEYIVTDLPVTFITVTRRGQSKRIEDYIGAPEGLKQLARQIDEAARTQRWVRIDVETLEQMVQAGRSPSAVELREFLRQALQYDDVRVVEALLQIGVDPNTSYNDTNTPPLMMVRSADAARALIRAGADPFATNDNGVTALGMAAHRAPALTQVLLATGVAADQPSDSDGRTPLWQAACAGNVGVVKLLLQAGANPLRQPGNTSAVQCARASKDLQRRSPALPPIVDPPFVADFDGVIALLGAAGGK